MRLPSHFIASTSAGATSLPPYDLSGPRIGLKRRSVRGGFAAGLSHGLKFLIQLGATAVLARLLSPHDFGLVAMTAVISGFIIMFADAGLSVATIQREDLNQAQISGVFWVNVALGGILALVMIGLARPIAAFYGEPDLVGICIALSATFVLGGLIVQHQAILRRKMRFAVLAAVTIGSATFGSAVGITMALLGAGYWSLVGLSIGSTISNAAGVWIADAWRPSLPRKRDLREALPLLKFGADVLTFNAVNYLSRRVDALLIGWMWGPVALAMYDKAYSMLLLPIKQINAPLGGVAVPALSRSRSEPRRHRRFFLHTVQLVASISLPAVCLIALYAEEVVRIWLGPGWLETAHLFRLLAVAAAIGAMNNPLGWFLISSGLTRRYRQFGVYNAAILITAFLIGVHYGAEGVALAYSVAMALLFVPSWCFVLRGTGVRANDIARSLTPPVVACVLAIATGRFVPGLAEDAMGGESWLAGIAGFSAVYTVVLLFVFRRWSFFKGILSELGAPRRAQR